MLWNAIRRKGFGNISSHQPGCQERREYQIQKVANTRPPRRFAQNRDTVIAFEGRGRQQDSTGQLIRELQGIGQSQRASPRVTHQNWHFDTELIQRRMKHLSLHFYGNGSMIRPIAVAVARPIESEGAITGRNGTVESRPILARAGIAVNQNDRPPGSFDHKVQPRFVDGDKLRVSLRIMMGNARSDIPLLESSGYVHGWCSSLGPISDVSGSHNDSPLRQRDTNVKGEFSLIRGDRANSKTINLSTSEV